MRELREGEPCDHPGCLLHITHPCEGCGRIGGRPMKKFTGYIEHISRQYSYPSKPFNRQSVVEYEELAKRVSCSMAEMEEAVPCDSRAERKERYEMMYKMHRVSFKTHEEADDAD